MSAMSEALERLFDVRAEMQARLEAVDAAIVALGGTPPSKQPAGGTFASRIFDLLRSEAGRAWSINQVGETLDMRYVTVARMLAQMAQEGLIHRVDRGVYQYGHVEALDAEDQFLDLPSFAHYAE